MEHPIQKKKKKFHESPMNFPLQIIHEIQKIPSRSPIQFNPIGNSEQDLARFLPCPKVCAREKQPNLLDVLLAPILKDLGPFLPQ